MTLGDPPRLKWVCLVLSALFVALTLQATPARAVNVRLSWTAPGDDSTYGRATQYDLRYSYKPRFPEDFFDSPQWMNLPTPGLSGSLDETVVTDLEAGIPWYFALRAKDDRGNWSLISNVVTIVPTLDAGGLARWPLAFSEAWPSPARRATSFALSLSADGDAEVEALDLSGRRVRTLARGPLEAGQHELVWNLRDDHGQPIAPGVYFVRAKAGGQEFRRRVVVVK